MKITNKNISDLKPYENNPRINDHAVEQVANSIKEFVMQTRTLKVDNETVNQQGKESVLVFLKE